MKLNKTLVAALVLGIGLTGCDNMVDDESKKEDSKTPVVEENENKKEDSTKEATDEKDSDKVEEDKEESSDESSDALDDNEDSDKDEESSSNSGSKADEIESLEQSIFDLRSSQRAVELLFEISPESTNAHEDELNSLLDESNGLLEEAQDALSQLKGE